jgi:hypothetical protein
LGVLWRQVRLALVRKRGVPIWLWYAPAVLAAIGASVPRVPARWRSTLAALVPLLVALPILGRLQSGLDAQSAGTLGGNYLVSLTLVLAPVVIARVVAAGHASEDERRVLALAVGPGLVGWAVVAYLSAASLSWASPAVGLAPLAAAVLVVWAGAVSEGWGDRGAVTAATTVLLLLVLLLFGTVFKDGTSGGVGSLTARLDGPLAGIATTPARAREIEAIAALGRRFAGPGRRVLFLGMPIGYLLVGGTPLTNAVWLANGPTDAETLQYFSRAGATPDVAFVAPGVALAAHSAQSAGDPLVAYLDANYRLAASDQTAVVYVRR